MLRNLWQRSLLFWERSLHYWMHFNLLESSLSPLLLTIYCDKCYYIHSNLKHIFSLLCHLATNPTSTHFQLIRHSWRQYSNLRHTSPTNATHERRYHFLNREHQGIQPVKLKVHLRSQWQHLLHLRVSRWINYLCHLKAIHLGLVPFRTYYLSWFSFPKWFWFQIDNQSIWNPILLASSSIKLWIVHLKRTRVKSSSWLQL